MCQLLLKEMFGYWEDISVAPGLSDSRGHRGFTCHVRENTERAGAGGWVREVRETLSDINHSEMLHVNHEGMNLSSSSFLNLFS